MEKKIQTIFNSLEKQCVLCDSAAELELEEDIFICDNCAQIQSELAVDASINGSD